MIKSARSFFIAVDICDREIIDQITKFQVELVKERFAEIQLMKDYHITLNFLGKLKWKDVDKIRSDLERIRIGSFYVTLQGVKYFPSEKLPIRVLWINVESSKLYSLVEEICKITSECYEENIPHVTIARVRKIFDFENLKEFIEKFKDYYFGRFRVRSFKLKANLGRSRVDRKYVDIQEYSLL